MLPLESRALFWERSRAMLGVLSRPIRIVMLWQSVATAVVAALGGAFAGGHGIASGVLGGLVGIAGGLTFAWFAGRNRTASPEGVLVAALKAEGIKVLVLIALLGLVLVTYQNCVVPVLIGAFIASTMIFGFAFFVRDA